MLSYMLTKRLEKNDCYLRTCYLKLASDVKKKADLIILSIYIQILQEIIKKKCSHVTNHSNRFVFNSITLQHFNMLNLFQQTWCIPENRPLSPHTKHWFLFITY